jgi:hypothetical protein
MYFFKIVFIDFWSANKMTCCLLEQEFDILSYAAWIPFLGFLEVVRCSLLVIATIMADDPALKRVRRAIGTVCGACGKHFDTSDGFDQHRTSGYLVGTPCHVLDDGSTPNWRPHRGRQCQQLSCKI